MGGTGHASGTHCRGKGETGDNMLPLNKPKHILSSPLSVYVFK